MDKDNKVREIVNQKFTEYLTANNCRKTPERYAILNLIYTEQGHFDMDSLYEAMKEHNFRVSRGTLYNTMQLLLDCNLVLKHQFGQNISFYEKAYNNDCHHHLICTNCRKVQEFKDTKLKTIIQGKKNRRFSPTHYSLYIYGLCSACAREAKENNKKNSNKTHES
ncbi:MAG: transcriptional repressor [Dysgonamonadaceae bacterium]|jgi:Fur family ferric uptake transcriptional regulator|nr:transcriptional repressor [Dysgonamonadaceae bacterium]